MNSANDLIPLFRFDTGGLPERLRFEAWRDIICPFFDTAPLVDEHPFDVRYETYALDGVLVSERASGAFSVARSARHLRQGDTDHVILRAYTRGRVVMGIGDMPVVLAPGTISLTDLRFEMHGHTTKGAAEGVAGSPSRPLAGVAPLRAPSNGIRAAVMRPRDNAPAAAVAARRASVVRAGKASDHPTGSAARAASALMT